MPIERVPDRAGCGVQGCLIAAVAIFVLLLIGILIVAVFRFSEPPQGPGTPVSTREGPGGRVAAIADRARSGAVYAWVDSSTRAPGDIRRPVIRGDKRPG